jgi:rod shape-determining protein MreD
MNSNLKHFIRFVILVLIQVLILNNVYLSGYINPFIYLLFIMLLPFNIDRIWLLLLGFLTGLTVDLLSGGVIGLHTAAATLVAFLRPYLLAFISSQREFDSGIEPSIKDMGFSWFLGYTLLFTTTHHLYYFFLEKFSFTDFFTTIWRILLSALVSSVMIIIGQYIEHRPKHR